MTIAAMSCQRRAQFIVLLYAAAACAHPSQLTPRATFNYGTIGDSWASGVSYGLLGYTNYDDNKSGCMRINHAYGVQLKDDWPGKETPNFTFAACSGSRLEDMFYGQQQMNKLDKDTHFVTMQAGGNDAGFYNVARDCIFHNEKKAYGAEYPDPSGECHKSVQAAMDFINRPHLGQGLWKFMDDTIRDIVLQHPIAKRPDFKLYVLGYAHLFNDNAEADWCNNESFSVSLDEFVRGNRVKLSRAVRSVINELTSKLDDQIQDVIRNFNNPKVVYVPITSGFEGHRFCEKGHTKLDQYFGDKVWFWNASPAGLFPPANTAEQKKADGDWSAAYDRQFTFQPNLEQFNWADLLHLEKGPRAASPHQGWSPGIALRPLHPKADGHKAIKDALKPHIINAFKL